MRLCDPVRACSPVFALYPMIRFPVPFTGAVREAGTRDDLKLDAAHCNVVPSKEPSWSSLPRHLPFARILSVPFSVFAMQRAAETAWAGEGIHVRESAARASPQSVCFMRRSSLVRQRGVSA